MTDNVYDVNTERAYHHGDLRHALILAGFEILEAEGRDALTLRSVSERTGVSKMAPYRHFADKSALLAAIAQHGLALLSDKLKKADRSTDDRQALIDLSVAHVQFAVEHPDLFRLMFGPDPQIGGDQKILANNADTAYGIMAQRVKKLLPNTEVEMATLSCWSFIHGLATLAIDRRFRPMPENIESMTRNAAEFLIGRITEGTSLPIDDR